MIPIQDTIPSRSFPIVNWTIIFINTLVFLFELSLDDAQAESLFYLFGLVPARFSHPEWTDTAGLHTNTYWVFITNAFLHGGWAHFLGNMWTLYIFGDNVEDRMGRGRYLVFYLLCGLTASLTHYWININSTVPAIGASGAISGVMAAYMLLFPRSRIIFLLPVFFLPYFIELSAFFYIGFWFISQLFSGTFSAMFSSYASGIAFWAHIGGFLSGVILYRLFTKKHSRHSYPDEFEKRFVNYY